MTQILTFDDLVAHGIKSGAECYDGMPWSFEFAGRQVTHENDKCYLMMTVGGIRKITPDDLLVVDGLEISVCPVADVVALARKEKESEFEFLKHCPFCGPKQPALSIQQNPGFGKTSYFVFCGKCCTSSGTYRTRREAARRWNLRNGEDTDNLREAVKPIVEFIRRFDAKPVPQNFDEFYGIHSGTEHEATLKLSDMRRIATIYGGQR